MRPAQIQPGEEVEIRLADRDSARTSYLHFDIKPDGVLEVSRYRIRGDAGVGSSGEPEAAIERTDRVRLPAATVAMARDRLSLFRPETLRPEAPFVMPTGCRLVLHGESRVVITYLGAGDHAGAFIIPRECGERSAAKLDAALRTIVASLPETEAASDFVW